VGWNSDTDFVLRLTARGAAAVTPEEMGTYYKHAGQLTGTDNQQSYRWKARMVERVMEDVADKPELVALRSLAEGEYLSRYAIHFSAAALRRGRREEAAEFLARVRALGLSSSGQHMGLYGLVKISLVIPGGEGIFRGLLSPVLRKLAVRFA